MTALQMSLTDKSLDKLPMATEGQYVVRDTELKGFLVVVGKRRKTFTVKGEGWQNGKRKNVYAAIGVVGDLTARDARLKAKEALTRIAKGLPAIEPAEVEAPIEPTVEAQPAEAGVTLWEAWERYLEAHLVRKRRSARTIASYADHVERIFKAWRDRPLKELGEDPALVTARHDEITRENGPFIANGAMRTLRAIYNHARKSHRYLPADNPVEAVDWNEESRRDTGMGLKALPAWFDELILLENPIRREFHLFTLLSGCRPGALKVAETPHLSFARRMLHIPAPKGGSKKAFDIPLSRPMIRCLIRAIRLSRMMFPEAGERWIFGAGGVDGHLAEQREDREQTLSKYGNDLRQTFRTIGQAAEVPDLDIHILMNHALQGVNA
ncbi:integrase family protein, partial [Phenylobacterium sp.]|uniref:tyrosine-type recombinase/integrase n=1 Tax=Phenylobacterium sp. TaxID=1871053 RepID=UPI0025D05A69